MHRPDTIIEIHRERVQDQTVEMFSGDKRTQSVDGAGYSATATLDLTLDRVWFILDSHQRLWQEEVDGEHRDPLRHFAIDLVIFDSKIVIDSVTCIPLVSLPPATITIPDGPRAGESREIPYNEIPLFGRLTIHDQLEPHQIEPGKQTIALNFTSQDAPALVATPLPDQHVGWLFGPHIERRSDGITVLTGQDPRLSWELDYAEAYWITHSIAGELMVNLEKMQHPSLPDEEARTRVLDSLAAQIADAVRPQLETMGDNGIQALLPSPVDVDPEARDDTTVKELDAVVQRFDIGEATEESMVVQLQTLRELPPGEELPASVLAENPSERAALAVTGWSILRQVRDTVMSSFDLDESDFDPDAPCALAGPKTISIGGQDRSLDALDADIVPRTEDGRLVVDGTVSADTKLYDFKASFKVTYEMGLGGIPRDPKGKELLREDVDSIELLEQTLSLAGQKKRAGHLSTEEYEAEVKQVSERFNRLPRTVGVRPAQNSEPDVNADFSLTAAGKVATAAGAAAVVGLLALPVTWVAGAAGVGAAGAGGLLTLAIAQYITTVLTVDWFGTGIGSRQVKKSLNDQPEGTSLPPIGMPIHLNLNRQRLAVYFRPVPTKLWIDCVTAGTDAGEEGDGDGIRVVGGRWPSDGHPWRLSEDDAVLFVDSNELQLLVDPATARGEELPVGVDTEEDGRRRLRVHGDPDALRRLPRCLSAEDGGREPSAGHQRDEERGGGLSHQRGGNDAHDRADKHGDGQEGDEQTV